jgi:hypothetical protein
MTVHEIDGYVMVQMGQSWKRQAEVVVFVVSIQDSTSTRRLHGSSCTCCIRNLNAFVHSTPITNPAP